MARAFVLVATAILFLVWLHRAYKNLRASGVKTEMPPGWAVGSWFIPFLNLVQPYQAMKELWIKSDPGVDFTHGFAKPGAGARAPPLIAVWWFAGLLSNFALRVADRIGGSEIAADHRQLVAWAGEAGSLLTLFTALLAAYVVWTIDGMQAGKSKRLGLDRWAAPPPPPSFDNSFNAPRT